MIKTHLAALKRRIKGRLLEAIFDRLMEAAEERPGRHPFGVAEFKLLRQALISQNLCCIDGQMVSSFEKEFAYVYGVPYGVASTSGTASIHVALGALDLNPGDEIVTAPITDMGTIIPILYQNCIPVFADIDDSYNMDPADVERKITPRTRAIVVVHLFGNPCDMDTIVEIAKRHRIPLIEDCSQAHLAEYKGRYVGTIGDIGCFSFQQSKQMTTGDGGMTITSNKSYYERMKLFADKGYARKGWGARAYLFHAPNYRMNELTGAVGLAQLTKIEGVIEKRRELGERLSALLSGVEGVVPAPVTAGAKSSYWFYPVRVHGVDIEEFAKKMSEEKVWVMPGYTGKPIYLCSESLTAKKTYGTSQWPFTCNNGITYEYKEGLCPRAEEILKHLACIPLDESWTAAKVEAVAAAVRKSLASMISGGSAGPNNGTVRSIAPPVEEPKKTIRVGIVGCGQIGRWHLDSYKKNPHAKIVAVADSDFSRAQAFAAEAHATPYSSHKEMIANEALDGVNLCTVPSTHKDIAIDLLNAGIHVLCEKPLAVSASQAEEMTAKASEKNRLLLTAFKFRFFDEVMKAKTLIEQGGLGNVLSFRLMFGGYIDLADTWFVQKALSGGGVIMDNGPHAIDLIRFLFGEIQSVVAHAARHQAIEVEDTAQLTFHMKNGVIGTADLTWSNSIPAQNYMEVYGENGTILLDFEGLSYKFKNWSEWKREPNGVDVRTAFARQINHFVEAMLGNGPSRLNGEDGQRSQAAIEGAYQSLDLGRKVEL
jgi:dTDP-4-amino-4,6-dideoxygalactose transaminase/predicted dehydrogenase